jgi:hypothetical protein
VACVVVEAAKTARDRGARVLAWIAGVGFGSEPGTQFGRPEGSIGAATAIDRALAQACLDRDSALVPAGSEGGGGLGSLVQRVLPRVVRGDVRVIVHHATAPGGQSAALVLKSR